MRAYGAGNLTAMDDASAVESRLLQWGIDLAHEAEPHLKGEGQQAWIKVIDDNVDNLPVDALVGQGRSESGRCA